MRLFDEPNRIKHSSGLMQTKRTLCLLLACGTPLLAGSQSNAPTYTYPSIPALPAAPQATGTPSAQTNTPPYTSTNASSYAGQGQTRQMRVMTLDECIKIALQHNLDIQIQEFNPIISQYALNVFYGNWEPTFTFTANKSYNNATGGINAQTEGGRFGESVTESDNYVPAIQGTLPTGLQYTISGNLQRASQKGFSTTNDLPPFHWLPPDFPATAGISLTQPLLKNFWIDNTRLQIQLNKANVKISQAALEMQIMTSITAVKSAYFNLLYGRDNVKAQQTAYELAEQLVKENLKRVEVGALAPLDEKQSESQAATSLAALHAAEYQLGAFENTLKNLLTDKYTEWADVTIIPAEELTAVPQDLNLQESWRRAVEMRPDLTEAKLRIEQQNVTLKYDFNQLFPELDVTGSYGHNATEATFDDTLSTLRQGNHSFYSYGAFVSIPLGGNYAARNQYKSAKVSLKQLLLTLKQTEQNILVNVDNDVGNVQSTLQQVYATRDARIYAQEALDAERKKLEQGKSTSFIVLQLISNLTAARVQEIQALANYNIALAQLALDEGTTLEANHIQLKVR